MRLTDDIVQEGINRSADRRTILSNGLVKLTEQERLASSFYEYWSLFFDAEELKIYISRLRKDDSKVADLHAGYEDFERIKHYTYHM